MSVLAAEQDWLASVNGDSVREFYNQIGVIVPDRQAVEVDVSCFANPAAHNRDDRNPSCSINLTSGLWKCHGCGQHGNAFQAAVALGCTDRRARELAQSFGLFLEASARPDEPKPRLPNERQLLGWRQDLWGSEMLMGRLWELKGWTRRAVVRCELGWDGERLVFPIRDKRLKRIGVVRYLPGGSPKSLALPGSKRGLFPAPETLRRDGPLFLVEGEGTAVSVRSCGLRAVGIPGASGWRPEFVQRLWGFRRLVMLPDCDAVGRELARRVTISMPTVRVVDVDRSRDDGYDIGDLVAEAAQEDALKSMRKWLEALS